jgi:hypothetical protein
VSEIQPLPNDFAIAHLAPNDPLPPWASLPGVFSLIVRSPRELAIVTVDSLVPQGVAAERGWKCLRLEAGAGSSVASPLVAAGIPLRFVSGPEADYLLLHEEHMGSAAAKVAAAAPSATHFPALAKQQGLAQEARTLHEEWAKTVGTGRLKTEAATHVVWQVAARAEELAVDLEREAITTEQHNDQRFVMVMAMRRLIDGGCDEPASRMIARAMHDLFADSPPLPHPRYRFTFDWVSPHAEEWRNDLAYLAGKPNIRGLEIGCFEGQSACWWLDNILTDPTSRLTCVDPFAIPMDSVLLRYFERYFDHNIAASGAGDRVTKLVGSSQVVLRALQPAQFDFVYVDGSHRVGDVLQDAVLAWTLLRPGGTAVFDDYNLVDDVAEGLLARAPGWALDAFVSTLGVGAKVMRRDWQLVLRKS